MTLGSPRTTGAGARAAPAPARARAPGWLAASPPSLGALMLRADRRPRLVRAARLRRRLAAPRRQRPAARAAHDGAPASRRRHRRHDRRRRHRLARRHASLPRPARPRMGAAAAARRARPTSSPTPISTSCIRSGRCRRRCARCSASTVRATCGSRRSARCGGCIFLLGWCSTPMSTCRSGRSS